LKKAQCESPFNRSLEILLLTYLLNAWSQGANTFKIIANSVVCVIFSASLYELILHVYVHVYMHQLPAQVCLINSTHRISAGRRSRCISANHRRAPYCTWIDWQTTSPTLRNMTQKLRTYNKQEQQQ